MAEPLTNRKFLMTLVAFVLVLLGMMYLTTQLSQTVSQKEFLPNRSVYNNKPTGYRAWYLAAEKAGVRTSVWRKTFSHLEELPAPTTMVMIAPLSVAGTQVIFSEKEARKLLRWVGQGNTLVLLDQFRRVGAGTILKSVNLTLRQSNTPDGETVDFQLHSSAHPALKVFLQGGQLRSEARGRFLIEEDERILPLLVDDAGQVAMVEVPYGKGTLILGTMTDLASNAFLMDRELDNYQMLTNLLVSQGHVVRINEYVHGLMDAPDVFSYYYRNTPMGHVFNQVIFTFALVLWLGFRPWRPQSPGESEKNPVGFQEFIQSMAGVYYRSQASVMALEPQLKEVTRLLSLRHRMTLEEPERLKMLFETILGDNNKKDGNASQSDLSTPDGMLQALQQAETLVQEQRQIPHKDLLRLMQQLSFIQDVLTQGNRYDARPYARSNR